jgi:hypothetical protein
MKKSIRIRYNAAGLTKPLPVLFQINLWHMPVRINFEVVSSSNSAQGYAGLHLAGQYHWSYNRAEWRRRHGYQRDVFGDYKVDDDWPESRRLTDEEGQKLDELLDQCVSYWVEVSIQHVLTHLEANIASAIARDTPYN